MMNYLKEYVLHDKKGSCEDKIFSQVKLVFADKTEEYVFESVPRERYILRNYSAFYGFRSRKR
jgi:hypothetical protein